MTRLGRCVEFVGLGDGNGCISFNKTVTAAALSVWAIAIGYILVRLMQIPPWYVWSFGIVVIGAGFGLKGFSVAMANRKEEFSVTSQYAVQANVAEVITAIKARRDPAQGVDPA